MVAPLSPDSCRPLSARQCTALGGHPVDDGGDVARCPGSRPLRPDPAQSSSTAMAQTNVDPRSSQLTQAVARAEAVINVVQTRGDELMVQVVDRTGGAVLRTDTAQVVQSYGRLATALGEQYLVAFQAPGELPALAEVTVKTGDVQSRTVVGLPEAGTSADAAEPPSERWIAVVLSRACADCAGWACTRPSAPIDGHLWIAAPRRPARPDHTPAPPSRHRPTMPGESGSAPRSPTGCRPPKRSADRASYLTPATSARCTPSSPGPIWYRSLPGRSLLLRRDRRRLRTPPARSPNGRRGATRRTTSSSGNVRQTTTSRGRCARSCPSTSGGQDEHRATTSDIAIGYRVGDGDGRRGRRGALG